MDNYYFVLPDKRILPLVGVVSYSTGDGLEKTSRYSYDYSRKPQSLTYRKRNTALTATVQMAFTPTLVLDYDINPMDYISDLEQVCGLKVDFYWSGERKGSFVIQSVQFSGNTDLYQIYSQMSVSLAMTEGYVHRETLYTAVSTL